MKKSKILIQLGLILGIVLVLNLIATKAFFRLDFTADQRYSLSQATEDILSEVEDVIDVKVYFTEKVPPQVASIRKDLEDMLAEYENISNKNLVYQFIDPNKDLESEKKAQEEGIPPITLQINDRDEFKEMRGYMGLTLESGGQKEVIQFIQEAGMEFAITSAIKKLTTLAKPKVGLLQGHGEASQNAIVELVQQLSNMYEVEDITITDTSSIPSYLKALMIINPTDTFPHSHLQQLDQFMESGGSVFLTYSAVNANLQQQFWSASPDIGMNQWLKDKGIALQQNLVVDEQCGSIQVQRGNFPIPLSMKFPYMPIITSFGDHPISKGSEQMLLVFPNAIELERQDSLVTATPLAISSSQSGVAKAPVYFNVDKQWTRDELNSPYQTVAMAMEGNIMGSTPSKLVVISSASFAINGEGQQRQRVNPENLTFANNAIDWLADDTGLVALRSKEVSARPIEKIEDTSRQLLKYGNVLIPILLLLIYGFIRKQRNQKKRQNWIQGQI